MKINFLSNWNDKLLVERSASVWMHILKYKLDVNTRDPNSLLHNRARCSDRESSNTFTPFTLMDLSATPDKATVTLTEF